MSFSARERHKNKKERSSSHNRGEKGSPEDFADIEFGSHHHTDENPEEVPNAHSKDAKKHKRDRKKKTRVVDIVDDLEEPRDTEAFAGERTEDEETTEAEIETPVPQNPVDGRTRNIKHRKALVLGKLQTSKATKKTQKVERPKSHRNLKHVMKMTMDALGASRFEKWKSEELILLLIRDGVELRNEASIPHSSLVSLADSYYLEKDMPEKLPPYSPLDIERIDNVIRKIQNKFIELCASRRKEEERLTLFSPPELDDMGAGGYLDFNLNDALADAEDGFDYDDVDDSFPLESQSYDLKDGTDGSTHWRANPIKVHKAGGTYERLRHPSDIEAPRESEYDVFGDGGLMDKDAARASRRRKGKSRAIKVLDIPWQAPSLSKAEDYMNYNQPRQGGKGGSKFHFRQTTTGRHCCLGGCGEMCDLWREGQISEFGIYGPGVTNYFKFTKWLFWLFFVLSIISCPELMLNLLGPFNNQAGLTDLSATTVGNLAPRNLNETVYIEIPLCPFSRAVSISLYGQDFNCAITRDTLGIFYSGFDILISLTVLIAFLWIRIFEKQEEILLDKNTVFASMYTLQIKNLPLQCTEKILREHLLRVLRCRSRAIEAVHIAVDNRDEFDKCVERGTLIKERIRLINLHRYETTRIREKYVTKDAKGEAKRKDFIRICMGIDEKIRNVESDLKSIESTVGSHRPLVAYVTFATIDDLERCLIEFGQKRRGFRCFFKVDDAILLDGKELQFTRAPEPSTIIWENLRFSFRERMTRRNLTTFLALLLILISVICTYTAKILQDRSSQTAGSELCPDGFDHLPKSSKILAVESDASILHCYCDDLSYTEKSTDNTCRSYFKEQISTQLVTYFASLIVLLVNICMEFVMQLFSNLEKHQSEDSAYRSVFLRLFALKYINTSCIFLINSNIQWLADIFGSKGNSIEFSGEWYRSVGVSIVLVQIGNIAFAHSKKFYDYFMYKRAIHQANKRQETDNPSVLTQDELNKLHEGPSFEFSINYAQLMTTFFVCLTFSAGMPILYIIGMFNFGFTYLVDKYLFINLYRIPNRLSTKIGREATGLVPWAVVLHLLMSIWAFSNSMIFSSTKSEEAALLLSESGSYSASKTGYNPSEALTSATLAKKVYHRHTYPLFLFVLIIVLFRVLVWLFTQLGYQSGRILGLVFDHGDGAVPKDSVAFAVGYSRAVQRNLIKGEPSYAFLKSIDTSYFLFNNHSSSIRLPSPLQA